MLPLVICILLSIKHSSSQSPDSPPSLGTLKLSRIPAHRTHEESLEIGHAQLGPKELVDGVQ